MDTRRFDFCVVGGGATGLGVALDAASRGHSVVLVEQADFAKGTSSRSTKLVHGGVRYLKQGNLALVRDALRERGRMRSNAPGLVRDLNFVIPIYRRSDQVLYGAGMKFYDLLSGRLSFGKSLLLNREETLRRIPTVRKAGLMGGVLYHDGQFDDSRLAVALARTAASRGAKVLNYVRCVEFIREEGKVRGILALDTETGRSFPIHAKCVINATGVFVDELRAKEEAGASPMVSVSQGIHFVLPKRFLPGSDAIMIPKTDDGRVLFALPWHDRVVLGTTDTPVQAASLEPRALGEEVSFLMAHAEKYLTEAPKPSDVLSVFAGLRPLVKAGGTATTASLSRDHTIVVSGGGLLTVTGGKWTTYRKMAEDVVDRGEAVGGLAGKQCNTADLVLLDGSQGGMPAAPEQAVDDQHLSLSGERIRRFVHEEMARTVEDVLARRSRWLLLDAVGSMAGAERVARLMAEELGKGAQWITDQIADYRRVAAGYCGSTYFGSCVEHQPGGISVPGNPQKNERMD